jgi:predicted Zn-dependent protease
MHQAETAAAAGDKEKARTALRAAAKVDPTNKAPWVKLSETYFASDDYGNAILAAQEVLQRDASDGVAASVLAVSGLRVSIQALGALRQQNNIAAGTRSEAETLAKSLRELLGEPVLVPRPVVEEPPPPPPRRRKRTAASAERAPAPLPRAAAANPFDKLK